jgi:ribonuclease HII
LWVNLFPSFGSAWRRGSGDLICSRRSFWLKEELMDGGQLSLAVESENASQFRPFEAECRALGFARIAGLDEAGRGPLAGPVVAAAVVLPRGFAHDGIKDSKALSAKQRESLEPLIRECAESCAVGVVEVAEIDRINILRASLLAMAKALDGLNQRPDCLLIDGNQAIPAAILRAGSISYYQKTVVKGDRLCLSIAAASIIAKVARDRMMVEADKRFPEYGFAAHKGYGSAAHLAALRRYGPSPLHRLSYKPVREAASER